MTMLWLACVCGRKWEDRCASESEGLLALGGSNCKVSDMIITTILQTRLGRYFSFEFSR